MSEPALRALMHAIIEEWITAERSLDAEFAGSYEEEKEGVERRTMQVAEWWARFDAALADDEHSQQD